MKLWIFLFWCIALQICKADTVTLKDSVSPNGKYFLTIEESVDNYTNTSDKLEVRCAADQKVVGSFDWSQFSPHLTEASAHALWKPDSSAFALVWYMTRGWTGTQVFANAGSKWTALAFPNYPRRFIGKNHIIGRGKGQFVADKWSSDGDLRVKYWEGAAWDGKGPPPNFGDVDESDWLFFRLPYVGGSKLKFLRLEPRHEKASDL